MEAKKEKPVDWEALLNGIFRGKTVIEYEMNRNVYRQGQPADALFYIRRGKVKLSTASQQGKEAIIAILSADEFFGEGCLAGQTIRTATATAITDCTFDKIEKPLMERMLRENQDISELFVHHLLLRNIRYEADLIDQLFNSSEKRLARILLLLSNYGKENRAEATVPIVKQETLAKMVGTTRSRVSLFMNRFREHGFIDYDDDGLTVHSGLLSVVLHDQPAYLRGFNREVTQKKTAEDSRAIVGKRQKVERFASGRRASAALDSASRSPMGRKAIDMPGSAAAEILWSSRARAR
jgi:CRP-like cAMP-binding protein